MPSKIRCPSVQKKKILDVLSVRLGGLSSYAYIGAVLNSIRNGSDARGYFVWSFMDLYELLSGYEFSFGLYYVNFSVPHRKRTPKLSAHWYSAFLKDNTTFLGSQRIAQLQSNFSSSY
ncbi:hypothetical protein Bca4012_013754 [Brassica carinata]|uniref:thioglucosidase n=1 Tax=Brassica carinata TaxID=52824 RepID=A0A8X7Q5M9_BRACI|nr:hypothetical protein Bca52824_068583 [Brassica carinata]